MKYRLACVISLTDRRNFVGLRAACGAPEAPPMVIAKYLERRESSNGSRGFLHLRGRRLIDWNNLANVFLIELNPKGCLPARNLEIWMRTDAIALVFLGALGLSALPGAAQGQGGVELRPIGK